MSEMEFELWAKEHPEEIKLENGILLLVFILLYSLHKFCQANEYWKKGRKKEATIANGVSAVCLLTSAGIFFWLSSTHLACIFLTLAGVLAVMTGIKYKEYLETERAKNSQKYKLEYRRCENGNGKKRGIKA